MTWRHLALGAALMAALTTTVRTQNLGADLQRAIQRAAMSGDCKAVLADYARIVEQGAKSNRAAAAEALLQAAMCHESLGDGLAKAAYDRLAREYAETTFAATALGKLAGGQGANARQSVDSAFVSRAVSQGADGSALASPDGKLIAFSSGPARNQQLMVRDATSRQPQVLMAASGDYIGKIWSPDSSRLAVQFRHAGSDRWEMLTIDTRTGKRQSLQSPSGGPGLRMVWSPGGDELAVSPGGAMSDADEVRILTLATSESRTVARGQLRPFSVDQVSAWTSDNHLVVWRRAANGDTEWFLAPAAGGPERSICITTLPANGGNDICRTVAPDGRTQVVFKRDSNRIMMRDLATGADRRLTVGTGEERFLMLSTDGRLAAFESNHEGRWAVWVAPIANAPVERPLRLGSLDRDASMPSEGGELWTIDGALTLGFYFDDVNIYRVDVDAQGGRSSGPPRRLTQDASNNRAPIVSPDSRQIAFWSQASQRGGLTVMGATGENERVVVRRDADFWSRAVWRSTYELLIPQPSSVSVERGIEAVNLTAGTTGLLPGSTLDRGACAPTARNFTFAVAASEVYYFRCSRADQTAVALRARSVATGQDRAVVELDYPTGFAVSPDGRRVAYSRRTSASTASAGRELWVVDATGDNKRLLFSATTRGVETTPSSWSPDGKYLLYQMEARLRAANSVYVMNVSSGESWPLVSSHPGIYSLSEASWSPDGSFIVMTGRSERYDWRRWEGVTYDAVMKLMSK